MKKDDEVLAARNLGQQFRYRAFTPFKAGPPFIVCQNRAWYIGHDGRSVDVSGKWSRILKALFEELTEPKGKPPAVNEKTASAFAWASNIRCCGWDASDVSGRVVCPECGERLRIAQLGHRVAAELGLKLET